MAFTPNQYLNAIPLSTVPKSTFFAAFLIFNPKVTFFHLIFLSRCIAPPAPAHLNPIPRIFGILTSNTKLEALRAEFGWWKILILGWWKSRFGVQGANFGGVGLNFNELPPFSRVPALFGERDCAALATPPPSQSPARFPSPRLPPNHEKILKIAFFPQKRVVEWLWIVATPF